MPNLLMLANGVGLVAAAGNICTEELVLLCEEMGIDTGVDLDALIVSVPLAK